MNRQNFNKLLQKYIDKTCNESERKIVDDWLNHLAANSDDTIQNPIETKAKFMQNIEAAVGTNKHHRGRTVQFNKWLIAGGIAALLVVGFIVIEQFYKIEQHFSIVDHASEKPNSTIVNTSPVSTITHLPDGSDVILYPHSKLTHLSFTDGERRMRLEGKAFFKVTPNPNRPFIIITEKLITKVLGTSFIIDAENGKQESVTVKTGKVAVYKSSNTDLKNLPESFVAVTPNHQVRFDEVHEKLVTSIVNHPVIIPNVEPTQRVAEVEEKPTNYEMKFEETCVAEILKALEIAYGVKIICENKLTLDCIITVNLKDEDLFMRLQVICDLIRGSYQVEGDVIVVKNQGCK